MTDWRSIAPLTFILSPRREGRGEGEGWLYFHKNSSLVLVSWLLASSSFLRSRDSLSVSNAPIATVCARIFPYLSESRSSAANFTFAANLIDNRGSEIFRFS